MHPFLFLSNLSIKAYKYILPIGISSFIVKAYNSSRFKVPLFILN